MGVFLPDGKRILVFTTEPRSYVQSLDSDTVRPITPPGVQAFWFTADGKNALGRDEHNHWALYPIEGGPPKPLPKWIPGDRPINHTMDNHSFFVRNGDLPVNVYRLDLVTGQRKFVRQLRPSDTTGMERLSGVLMTPDGKYYVYGGQRDLSDLFVVSGLK